MICLDTIQFSLIISVFCGSLLVVCRVIVRGKLQADDRSNQFKHNTRQANINIDGHVQYLGSIIPITLLSTTHFNALSHQDQTLMVYGPEVVANRSNGCPRPGPLTAEERVAARACIWVNRIVLLTVLTHLQQAKEHHNDDPR